MGHSDTEDDDDDPQTAWIKPCFRVQFFGQTTTAIMPTQQEDGTFIIYLPADITILPDSSVRINLNYKIVFDKQHHYASVNGHDSLRDLKTLVIPFKYESDGMGCLQTYFRETYYGTNDTINIVLVNLSKEKAILLAGQAIATLTIDS